MHGAVSVAAVARERGRCAYTAGQVANHRHGSKTLLTFLSMRPSPSPTELHVARLFIYPIKSCAGIELPTARLTETGLAHGLRQTLRVGQALELDYGFE